MGPTDDVLVVLVHNRDGSAQALVADSHPVPRRGLPAGLQPFLRRFTGRQHTVVDMRCRRGAPGTHVPPAAHVLAVVEHLLATTTEPATRRGPFPVPPTWLRLGEGWQPAPGAVQFQRLEGWCDGLSQAVQGGRWRQYIEGWRGPLLG